jgi:hypothetical protein
VGTDDDIKGIDVSRWQTTTPSLTGLSFLFARASIGTKADEKYAMHIANARAAGLFVGAYHFNHAPLSVASQVAAFLTAAGDVDFYAIDVEGGDAFSRDQTAAFIKGVQATGRKCGLYHSLSGFFDAGQDFDWIAYWSDQPPTRDWDFWQWQGSPLDRDIYGGTLAELQALAGKAASDVKFIYAIDGKLLRLPVETPLYGFDGTVVTKTATARDWPVIGAADGHGDQIVIRTGTGAVYPDGKTQPTCLIAKTGTLVDAPAPVVVAADCSAEVAAAISADRAKAKVTWS